MFTSIDVISRTYTGIFIEMNAKKFQRHALKYYIYINTEYLIF